MDRKLVKPVSNFMLNQCATGLVDRISALPDEIIVVILSFLSLREAATTSVLSSRWVDLWKHTPNLKYDNISRLPDSIIVHILSFLPLKTAAATSVLCSRWLDLWKHTSNLDFTTYKLKLDFRAYHEMRKMETLGLWDAEKCKYIELVNSVIKSHKAPSLKQFAISFFVNQSATCIVAKWLEFAFSRGVERLVLGFLCIEQMCKVVLKELLRESGLCSSPQTLILFKSLKSLCITHVNVNGEAVKIFLVNCPLLEELIISYSDLWSNVEVCGATLLLKHLELSHCHGLKSLRVSAPNLTRLKFDDGAGKLFHESLPKLVEAEFGFLCQSVDVIQSVASALFCFSSQLEILNLTLRWPKVFLANEFAEMPKLRKLVIEYWAPKTHSLLPVTALLWASPHLEEFKLKFMETSDGDAAIEVRRNGERCRHLHLKLFELTGFVDGAVGHLELVTYILDNCVGLEKIEIFFGCPPLSVRGFLGDASAVASRNYVNQYLQGKLPQHVQLQLSYRSIFM